MTEQHDFASVREALLVRTKKAIAASVTPDTLIMQTLAVYDELTTQVHQLTKRLREWHAYTLPELSQVMHDHERYVQLVAQHSQTELLKRFAEQDSMGALLKKEDYMPIQAFARQIAGLYDHKEQLFLYLQTTLQSHMRNVEFLAGTRIAAQLLASAGSLRRLAMMPASTIQLLGAEKALFRHLRGGAKSPKHGFIYNHPLLQQAKRSDAGRIARGLADKIALCAKLDFFKGEFKADEYRRDLERKFGVNA